ncbi:MAG: hypothetical protein KAT65_05295 [Methanophagales archaeon]|nr:hypothetical protein [Methanophagales archaeon]
MVTIKIISIEEIPKTRKGKMFLFFLILAAISFTVMLLSPSRLTAIAFVVIFTVTIINIFIGGKEFDKRKRVIEMLREFISRLISTVEGKIEEIDRYLGGDKRFALTLMRADYKYAHTDILGDKNYNWIKEKVDEYNNLVKAERFKEAKEIATELKGRLEELKKKHAKEYDTTEKEIEKKKHTPYVIRQKKRTKESDRHEPR